MSNLTGPSWQTCKDLHRTAAVHAHSAHCRSTVHAPMGRLDKLFVIIACLHCKVNWFVIFYKNKFLAYISIDASSQAHISCVTKQYYWNFMHVSFDSFLGFFFQAQRCPGMVKLWSPFPSIYDIFICVYIIQDCQKIIVKKV